MDGENPGQGSVNGGTDMLCEHDHVHENSFLPCRFCRLISVRFGRCDFCEECQGVYEENDRHTCAQPFSHSSAGNTVPGLTCQDHASSYHQGTVDREASRRGDRSAHRVESDSDQSSLGRSARRASPQPRQALGGKAVRSEASQPKEGRPDCLLGERGSQVLTHCDDQSVVQGGGGGHLQEFSTIGQREGGIRKTRGLDLPGSPQDAPSICELGSDNRGGKGEAVLAPGATGQVVRTTDWQARAARIRSHLIDTHLRHDQGRVQEGGSNDLDSGRPGRMARIPGHRAREQDRETTSLQELQATSLELGGGESSPSHQDHGIGGSSGRLGASDRPHEGAERDVDCECHALSEESLKRLSQNWGPRKNMFSEGWKDIVHHGRPLLLEVACFHDSILGTEVERRFGPGSCMRLSEWNGGNLEEATGVELIKKMMRRHRPINVWISCECGPFCPLQRLNRRNPQQIEALEEKQFRARKQYQGAIEVAQEAFCLNLEVHWEFSQRSEAWALPEIQQFLEQYHLQKVTTSGCAVGLKTKDRALPLCKAWTVATRNTILLQRLHLPCQKNHPKGRCEAGQTAHTARYTDVFAKKVIDCFCEGEVWSKIVQELSHTNLEEAQPAEADSEDHPMDLEIPPDEQLEIEQKLQYIHKNTGHGSHQALLRALERRGVSEKVLQVARKWSCPQCAVRKIKDPRRFATLETLAAKWETLEVDAGTWQHPVTKKKCHFVVMVDRGSKLTVSKVLHEHPHKTATWADLRQCLEEHWFPLFGRPKTLRVDPAGAWLNKEVDTYCSEQNILLEMIPGEAHWQLSTVEQHIKTIKGMLNTLGEEFPEGSVRDLMSRAVWAMNNRTLYRGYSPLQHVLGKAPDACGRMFDDDRVQPIHPELMADGGFQEDDQIRHCAEKAFLDEQAKRRLERAERMGHRRHQVFLPGDLVYYFRMQVPHSDRQPFQTGRFLGPARVLATETRREDGQLRPGSVIWLYKGGRLLRAAPEQVRKASEAEIMLEELEGAVEIPWTLSHMTVDPKQRAYQDISKEIPDDVAWEKALDEPIARSRQEQGAPLRRVLEKGPLPSNEPVAKAARLPEKRGEKREAAEAEPESGSSSSSRPRVDYAAFYSVEEHCHAVEIELQLPTSNRGWKKFSANPEAYMANQLKRKMVEVSERKLSPQEAEEFAKAKHTEVKNFLASRCFQLAEDQFPEEKNILGMRWLLTWKYDPKYPDGRKAKARAIVLGYQDPCYSERQTSSPTPSKAGRQLFLQLCAHRRFRIAKGDVSGAFLQGEDMEEILWCRPVEEICSELGVSPETPMLLKKAAYGLVQAPLHWYESICKKLASLGYTRLITEPCCWIYIDKAGLVRSAIHGHVDDFMFGGKTDDPVHNQLMQ